MKLTQMFEVSRRFEICFSIRYHVTLRELVCLIHPAEWTKQGKCAVLYFYIYLKR